MFIKIIFIGITVAQVTIQSNSNLSQIESFRERTRVPIGIMTTSAGAPISVADATNTLNTELISNEYFMDSITHLSRERIPERVVHAKGAGAFGYFIVKNNITSICKSKLFNKDGKKTPIAVRFSLIAVEKGHSDVYRDGRGFAVKFYTEEGNFDIVGLSIPVFVIKDPRLFPTFAHSMKRNPATNLQDPNMMWDFLTLQPESLHMYSYLFGDYGIFNGYRHMPGFSIHTFQVENDQGDINFIRFHFIPNSGIIPLTSEQARNIQSTDLDYNARDLYMAIENGNFPVWIVYIQVVPLADVKKAGSKIIDVTRTLPQDIYPLKILGKLVLTRNPINNFAEIEQLAFCPTNLVNGIYGGADTLYQARKLSYRDAQYYRLGTNFNRIQVNCPYNKVFVYNRDGSPPVRDNEKDAPNYFPNSFNGPVPYFDKPSQPLIRIVEEQPHNFDQIREYYTGMTDDQRNRFIKNILDSLSTTVKFLQHRAVKIFYIIHPNFGKRIEHGLLSKNINFSRNNT